uniref:Uncharacterized protein n=1 Tax=Physcomitrium patens TaxID=3218 RepID=A0A2K1IWQ5_PHYPA|nr:hypothetical protein PHYPA_023514 [Physcomitrium patens]
MRYEFSKVKKKVRCFLGRLLDLTFRPE